MAFSDLQLALLGTTSFVIFYTLLGVPFGRLADRVVRKNLIACGLAVWSLFSGLTGFAHGFWALFLCRVMVGVGEATLGPAALSLLSDYFPPRMRATVQGVYSSGIAFGGGLAFFLGGWIGQSYGWRWAFYLLGFPGLALAVARLLPARAAARTHGGRGRPLRPRGLEDPLPLGAAALPVRGLCALRARLEQPRDLGADLLRARPRHAASLTDRHRGGDPVDRRRRAGHDPRRLSGRPLPPRGPGRPHGVQRLGRRSSRSRSGSGCCSANKSALLVCLNVFLFGFASMWVAPATADLHEIAGPHLRGLGIGIFFSTVNILAYGLGAPLIGKLNDLLGVAAHPEQMRLALLVCPVACALAALLLWLGSRARARERAAIPA